MCYITQKRKRKRKRKETDNRTKRSIPILKADIKWQLGFWTETEIYHHLQTRLRCFAFPSRNSYLLSLSSNLIIYTIQVFDLILSINQLPRMIG